MLHGRVKATQVTPRVVSAERPNTLGLGQRELGVLLDMLDALDGGARKPVRREFARWPFRQTGVSFALEHPGGSSTALRLACRNLSRGGVSLLHAGYFHTGSRCRIELPKSAGGTTEVRGQVTRCMHRRGTLHEIGVKFDRPINLREYVGGNNAQDIFSLEMVRPQSLKARLLHVEDCDLDATIVKHFLRETNVTIDLVKCGSDALAKAMEPFDIILLDWRLPDISGTEVARKLRAGDITCPILMVTVDAIGLMKENLWEMPAVSMLTKPFAQDQLLRAIAEQLLLQEPAAAAAPKPGASTGGGGPMLPPELVKPMIETLDKAVREGNVTRATEICMQLKGVAPSLGLTQVAKAAELATSVLPTVKAGEAIPRAVHDLVAACRRAVAA
jgi:CheY-like chemotaxis protein